jgi:hypothetical protein
MLLLKNLFSALSCSMECGHYFFGGLATRYQRPKCSRFHRHGDERLDICGKSTASGTWGGQWLRNGFDRGNTRWTVGFIRRIAKEVDTALHGPVEGSATWRYPVVHKLGYSIRSTVLSLEQVIYITHSTISTTQPVPSPNSAFAFTQVHSC